MDTELDALSARIGASIAELGDVDRASLPDDARSAFEWFDEYVAATILTAWPIANLRRRLQIIEGAVLALRAWLTDDSEEADELFRESKQQVYPALAQGIVRYHQDLKGLLCLSGRARSRAPRAREHRTRRRAAMRSSARSGDGGTTLQALVRPG